MSPDRPEKPMKRSFLATMMAIAWSFVGLRSRKDFEEDANGGLNPVYVVIAGLLGTAIFVAVLLFFVRHAVR